MALRSWYKDMARFVETEREDAGCLQCELKKFSSMMTKAVQTLAYEEAKAPKAKESKDLTPCQVGGEESQRAGLL